jgi:hypothetical protein
MMHLPPGRPTRTTKFRAAVLALALLAPSIVRAEPARVALAQPAGSDELQIEVATRIRAELETAQFEVVVVTLDAGVDPRQGVEMAGLEPRPMATIAIVRLQNRPAVDVWVSDRVTGKTLVKRLDVARRDASSALAIHAVELLRASLLELRTQSTVREGAPAEGAAPVTKEVSEWVDRAIVPEAPKPIFSRPAIGVAVAALMGSPRLGPAFAPVLRASVGGQRGFAARLTFVGPAVGAEHQGASGTATLRQELALAEIVYAPSRRALVPIFSAGIGGYHLRVKGDATDPSYRGVPSDVWALLGDVGLGVAARLGSSAALSLDVHGFFTQPAATVVIGDATIGTVGRPSILASLGLLAAF